jgi:hypothetical protein
MQDKVGLQPHEYHFLAALEQRSSEIRLVRRAKTDEGTSPEK